MRRRGRSAASVFVLTLLAWGPVAASPPPAPATAHDSVAADPEVEESIGAADTSTVPGLPREQAQVIAFNLEPVVEELRGLRFQVRVPVAVVDDAAARTRFLDRVQKFWPAERMRLEQEAYVRLGLWPADQDLMATLLGVLEEQAGGFYDPDGGTFYVLGDMPPALAPIIMAHELAHALDDQHFDLDAGFTATLEDHDRGTAYSAVVEGSGMLVMTRYVMHEMQAGRLAQDLLQEFQESEMGRAQVLLAAPQFLQRSLLAAYVLGQQFLLRGDTQRLLTGPDPEDIERAFRSPPVSSEQLLHPEKYWDTTALDAPRQVPSPDLAGGFGPKWLRVADGNLGELFVAMLAGGTAPDPTSIAATRAEAWTHPAATGWGGDRWQLYECGDATAVVLATVWDSEDDAVEFETACVPVAEGGIWRRGDAVVVVAGVPAKRAAGIAAEYLSLLVRASD